MAQGRETEGATPSSASIPDRFEGSTSSAGVGVLTARRSLPPGASPDAEALGKSYAETNRLDDAQRSGAEAPLHPLVDNTVSSPSMGTHSVLEASML